jgi:hypothetical protein
MRDEKYAAFARWADAFEARDYPVLTPLLPPMVPIAARSTILVDVQPWRLLARWLDALSQRLADLAYLVSERAVRSVPNPQYDPEVANRYFVKKITIGQSYHPDIAHE